MTSLIAASSRPNWPNARVQRTVKVFVWWSVRQLHDRHVVCPVRRRRKGFALYFGIISKWCHAGGELLYRCQPPHYPTLICIIIMVSPTEQPVGGRPVVIRDYSIEAHGQPQKRLQINVTFLCALIWTLPQRPSHLLQRAHPSSFPRGSDTIMVPFVLRLQLLLCFCSRGEDKNRIDLFFFEWPRVELGAKRLMTLLFFVL